MLHVVAERNVHVAAVELAGQAAAVEWRDGVRAVRGGEQPLLVSVNEKGTFNCSKNSTCTSVGAWGRPLCLKSICKTSERHRQSHKQPVSAVSGKVHENVSHEVPPVAVGQDFGDIPVPGGQRLQDVCARVRLRVKTNVEHNLAQGKSHEFNATVGFPVIAHHGGRH